MNHVHVMLQSDLNNFICCQVSSNRSILTAFPNDIGLVGFYMGILVSPLLIDI
jgi:hypothetical protein